VFVLVVVDDEGVIASQPKFGPVHKDHVTSHRKPLAVRYSEFNTIRSALRFPETLLPNGRNEDGRKSFEEPF